MKKLLLSLIITLLTLTTQAQQKTLSPFYFMDNWTFKNIHQSDTNKVKVFLNTFHPNQVEKNKQLFDIQLTNSY
jgi:hypothetical protein